MAGHADYYVAAGGRCRCSKEVVHRFDIFVLHHDDLFGRHDYLCALLQERLYLRGIFGH
jgi:hypothetical protein